MRFSKYFSPAIFQFGLLILPFFTLLGIADTLLLVYNYFFAQEQCIFYSGIFDFLNGACAQVSGSAYGNLLGLPLSFWGLAFYLALFLFFLLAIFHKEKTRWYFGSAALVGVGWIFSLWLFYVQWKVLNFWCPLCLVSFTIVNLLALILLVMHFSVSARPAFSLKLFLWQWIFFFLIFIKVYVLKVAVEFFLMR